MKHIEGHNREQMTLFPAALDDNITREDPVRFIDAFLDSLDLGQRGSCMPFYKKRDDLPITLAIS